MNGNFWHHRRVFVTGHTGFKGAWLCLWLHRLGAKVAGYALAPPTSPSLYRLADVDKFVQSTLADIRDLPQLTRAVTHFAPEIVIHMAAQSVVLRSYEEPVETYATNVMGTVNMLEAVRRTQRRVAVINVTTDKCYVNRQSSHSYKEDDALGGSDPYSNSKACSELVTQAYRRSFFPVEQIIQHGVALASARAGNVIGGGDWTPHQLVPDAVAAFAAGGPVTLRHPNAVRPWQHVLDCLHGYLCLAEALAEQPERFSGEWNFGSPPDDAVTVAQLVEALAVHWEVGPAWRRAEGVLAHEELELRLDSSKANRLLDWRCKLPVHLALDWVADWYLQRQSNRSAREICAAQIEAFTNLANTQCAPA